MSVTTTVDADGIATIVFDDGAKNVLSLASIAALLAAWDEAAAARAVVTAGRPGVLSAGLDIKHVQQHGPAGAKELILALGELSLRIWTDPRPTVCAATGHALAGGVILAMSHDHVVATEGQGRWGLIETRVNLEVPALALALAGQRLSPRHINEYVLPGTPIDTVDAVRVGYADESMPQDEVVSRARAIARERAELPAGAYGGNKARLRQAHAERISAGVPVDVDAVVRHLGVM